MIGFGATIGAMVFGCIGARFQKSFDRWHAPSRGSGTRRGNPVRFAAFIRVCNGLLDRNSFNHYRGSMVLCKGDRCARQFPAGPVPYASRIARINCTDIDRRLGCPRDQHDRRFWRRRPRSRRRTDIVHPLRGSKFRRRRDRWNRLDRQRPAHTIIRSNCGGSQGRRR